MKSHFYEASAILLAFLMAGCLAAADAPTPAGDVAAIKALFDKHAAAFNAGDAAAVMALFTDDGVLMPPDRAPLTGKEGIRWGLRTAFGLYAAKISAEAPVIEVAGDRAFARRKYTMTLTGKTGGAEMDLVANWLDILKRQADGSWKIALEMVVGDRRLPTGND
jgi:uncharacterized protein (TIGR02246 family)